MRPKEPERAPKGCGLLKNFIDYTGNIIRLRPAENFTPFGYVEPLYC